MDELRENGEKVGIVKVRMFRPFPAEDVAKALSNVKAVAILDRAESFSNQGGPLAAETAQALFRARSRAYALNYIYGLGGRDLLKEHITQVLADLKATVQSGAYSGGYKYLGVRE